LLAAPGKTSTLNANKTVEIRLSEVLSALSYALDITEGQPEGHAIRNCMLGMTVADHLGMSAEDRSALFYALLLKDLGCSSNSSKVTYLFGSDDRVTKKHLKTVNWVNFPETIRYVIQNVGTGGSIFKRIRHFLLVGIKQQEAARGLMQTRCERGADIARELGFPEATAQAILDLDEHWDGKGHPKGLKGEEISLLGRILGFAQTVEVFYFEYGVDGARRVARERRGTWFDPQLSDIFLTKIASDDVFWQKLKSPDLIAEIGTYEPPEEILHVDDDRLDKIAAAFARVIDAKSPYTFRHSARVAEIVVGMAEELRMPAPERRELSRAALLHDIGKLGVSNMVLDKRGKLNASEWEQMRKHTDFTYRILERVQGFSQLADMASAHHERIDGNGYHRHVASGELSSAARLLAVADQYEALTAIRPYRGALAPEKALEILRSEVGTGIDPLAYEALRAIVEAGKVPPAAGPEQRG
jgi:putative nucleotidyltransferase with HDIG domain